MSCARARALMWTATAASEFLWACAAAKGARRGVWRGSLPPGRGTRISRCGARRCTGRRAARRRTLRNRRPSPRSSAASSSSPASARAGTRRAGGPRRTRWGWRGGRTRTARGPGAGADVAGAAQLDGPLGPARPPALGPARGGRVLPHRTGAEAGPCLPAPDACRAALSRGARAAAAAAGVWCAGVVAVAPGAPRAERAPRHGRRPPRSLRDGSSLVSPPARGVACLRV